MSQTKTAAQFAENNPILIGQPSKLHPGKTLDPLAPWQVAVACRFAEAYAESELAALREQLKRFTAKDQCLPEGFAISDDCSAEFALRIVDLEAKLAASERQCQLEVACRQSAEHALREQVRLREESERIAEGLAEKLRVIEHECKAVLAAASNVRGEIAWGETILRIQNLARY